MQLNSCEDWKKWTRRRLTCEIGSSRREEKFWDARNHKHRLAAQGLPPGAIAEKAILRAMGILMVLRFWEI